MKKITYILFLVLVICSLTLQAHDKNKISDFKLKDYNGNEYSLSNYSKSKAIVIMFIATQCPVSNAYNERMESIYNSFKDKNISFLGINSNKQESVDEIKEHAKENKLNFIILKDTDNIIADKFDAKFTPEIFVLNPNFEVVYHGRIDDSRRVENVKTNDLINTLNEILEGKEVSTPETKAFGCTIKRVDK